MAELTLLAVHQGGGVGGAPVSLLKLLAALDPALLRACAVFTEAGPILDYARELEVPAAVVPTGGAFFYSAHARLGARMLARFLRTYPASVQRARRSLRERRPGVLHLNTSVLLAWAAAARRERVPVVWVVREVLGPNPHLRRWHAGYILRHAARVVAVSGAVRACFPPDRRLSVVHNAVDAREFNRLPPGSDGWLAVRRELGLEADDAVIMAIGSVQRAKGHWLLLDALERLVSPTMVERGPEGDATGAPRPGDAAQQWSPDLRPTGAGITMERPLFRAAGARREGRDVTAEGRPIPGSARARLVFVAGGVDSRYDRSVRGRLKRALGRPLDSLEALLRDAARRGLRERVGATGFRRDIARVVAAADVVAFPSLAPEGFGRPIIEAMAAGRPVVATDVGPSAELLGPDAGLLVPPDARALAEALARILGSAELRQRTGAAGRARVERHFTLDRQVGAMETLYREAMAGA